MISYQRTSSRLLALVLLASLSSSARAQQQCHNASVNPTATSFTTTIRVPKFTPGAGDVLTGVTVQMSGRADGGLYMENHNNSPRTVTSHFAATFNIRRPDNSVIVTSSVDHAFTDTLAAYDGTQNYAGPSGTKHEGLSESFAALHTSPAPVSDLALFTGSGSITLTVEAIDTSSFTPNSNITTDVKQDADLKIQVCYTYSKDCNNNGTADSVDIQNGAPDANIDGIPDECQASTKTYCEGDGPANGGAACPCGNNSPAGTTRGCINGTGVGGSLTATGDASVSNDTLHLTASHLPNGSGYFFQGTAMDTNGNGTPFGNGLRCVAGNVIRIRKIPTGTNGGTLPGVGQPPIHIIVGVSAGDTRFYQVWYRDGQGPCGNPFNTTNAVAVVWGL
jgi:hypothetical protein